MVDPADTSVAYTDDFADVLKKEYAAAWRRRPAAEREKAGEQAKTGELRPPALYGVALSGGGIRSASFCLGALQALDQEHLVERIDYLSTVSGGGYTGASMIAGMRQNGGKFPFSLGTGDDIHDNEPVNHIRDNSRFLAPRGIYDLFISLAVILRGLMVNFLLVLSVLLPLATFMILVNPTKAHLERSIVLDIVLYWFPDSWQRSHWFNSVEPYLADPFLLTKIAAILLAGLLIAWALHRSFVESYDYERARRTVEPESWGASWGRRIILWLLIAAAVELQPPIIRWLIHVITTDEVTPTGAGTVGAIAGAIITMTAAFRGTLVGWIQRALNSPTVGARIQAMFARLAIYAAGLALPLMIYAMFLVATIWGIRMPYYKPEDSYPFAPEILAVANPYVSYALLAAILIAFLGRTIVVSRRRSGPNRLLTFFMALYHKKYGWAVPLALTLMLAFLVMSAIATRNTGQVEILKSIEWTVLLRYALASLLVILIGWNFTENANGLHRLYRDRLNAAFRLGRPKAEPMRLSELDDNNPYIILNGTLNVRNGNNGEDANPTADPTMRRRTDPAKRGRNAEFFQFSRFFVGSEATGFVRTEDMESVEPQLDLATAAAISGAAVSSSMGRISIGLLGPTLALLNLRLGYWLTNPKYLKRWKNVLSTRSGGDPAKRQWDDILRLYLFAEAFGRMRADSSRIYITDGGHIDNIGLYQLLKRRCKFIVVIDGEADPAMNFGAFCDVQRFARIDEGVRVVLDWRTMREAAIRRAADKAKRVPLDSDDHSQHFAIGRILYESEGADTEEGVLIYVKASVTGDEADYVLDYERRYPLFPHESTGDQFFSEEQMEAYRALGYHAMTRALKSKTKASPPRYSESPQADDSIMARMKRELRPQA